jgi:hypothetical protein
MVWFHGAGEPKKAQVVNVVFDDNIWTITIRLDIGRLECAPHNLAPLDCWNGHWWSLFEWDPIESRPDDCTIAFDNVIKAIAYANSIEGEYTTQAIGAKVIATFGKQEIHIIHDNLIIKSIKVD